ncbi:CinA family protein [Tepidimonas charontis]|uniref:Nicotinamide-nucleotide amidohydrolase PncC n=1 Tax=Tepidimonas charontis TaxID=2267262 RepID=A0A554XHF1_9BURK|nr:CinA family protein [Tepidimonas charontis]TSE35260.1 Nicotinamide-nucleotide amidohydrolase PncC [Tepidimonas charontis]
MACDDSPGTAPLLWVPAAVWPLLGDLATALRARGWHLVTAESCTGGLVAACCTALAGSSDWFERGFVTYSNAAKVAQLGVDAALLATHGAVSEPVARAMAHGAALATQTQVALAITGIAGPTGGSAAKPVGAVWFGWCVDGRVDAEGMRFDGDRAAVRAAAVEYALAGLVRRVRVSDAGGR